MTLDDLGSLFGWDDRFGSFMPHVVVMDEHVTGTHPMDKPWWVYVGNLFLEKDACKGDEFGGSSEALNKFIAECPEPPIYIGWGSVKCMTSAAMTSLAVRTLKLTGRRGIILGGWAELSLESLDGEVDAAELKKFCTNNVLFLKTANHMDLFPKCAVLVHHGGSGTTAYGFRSGVPNVITPILYDQFDSARIAESCGQGARTEHFASITPEILAKKIKECLGNLQMQQTAKELGAKMRARDGVKEAVAVVNKFMKENVKTGLYWKKFDAIAKEKKGPHKSMDIKVTNSKANNFFVRAVSNCVQAICQCGH